MSGFGGTHDWQAKLGVNVLERPACSSRSSSSRRRRSSSSDNNTNGSGSSSSFRKSAGATRTTKAAAVATTATAVWKHHHQHEEERRRRGAGRGVRTWTRTWTRRRTTTATSNHCCTRLKRHAKGGDHSEPEQICLRSATVGGAAGGQPQAELTYRLQEHGALTNVSTGEASTRMDTRMCQTVCRHEHRSSKSFVYSAQQLRSSKRVDPSQSHQQPERSKWIRDRSKRFVQQRNEEVNGEFFARVWQTYRCSEDKGWLFE